MAWNLHNTVMEPGFTLQVPRRNLYSDLCFVHDVRESDKHFSHVHQVHNQPVPLHSNAEMWIGMHTDTLQNKENYGIVRINSNGTESWIGGTYARGGIAASIRELGDRYAVTADEVPPSITPIEQGNWASQRRIRIRLRDNLSGISSFRGEINGEFVLFTHDSKSTVYTYRFDDSRLKRGETQTLTFTAVDGAGNRSEYRYTFTY